MTPSSIYGIPQFHLWNSRVPLLEFRSSTAGILEFHLWNYVELVRIKRNKMGKLLLHVKRLYDIQQFYGGFDGSLGLVGIESVGAVGLFLEDPLDGGLH